MAEKTTKGLKFGSHSYSIPEDLSRSMPVHFANYTELSVTSDGIGFMFCTKLDTLGQPFPDPTAIPQACVFMSIDQAEGLAHELLSDITAFRAALEAHEQEKKTNV